jgi:hypothetical protein
MLYTPTDAVNLLNKVQKEWIYEDTGFDLDDMFRAQEVATGTVVHYTGAELMEMANKYDEEEPEKKGKKT